MRCKKCGSKLDDGAKFCSSCGKRNADALTEKDIRRKNIFIIVLAVAVVLLVLNLVFIWYGQKNSEKPEDTVVPGNSEPASGSDDQTVIKSDYENALDKLDLKIGDAPVTGSADDYRTVYGEVREVDAFLTQQEVVALLTSNRPAYDPVQDLLIKINPDNTVDFSATARTQDLLDTLSGTSFSDLAKSFPLLIFMPDTVKITGNSTFEIENNKVKDLTFNGGTFMGINIPASMYSSPEANEQIILAVNNYLAKNSDETGTRLESVKIQDGGIAIRGKIPSSVSWEPIR